MEPGIEAHARTVESCLGRVSEWAASYLPIVTGPSETVQLVRPWPHHFFRDLAQFVLPTKLVFKLGVYRWVFRVGKSATDIRAASCEVRAR